MKYLIALLLITSPALAKEKSKKNNFHFISPFKPSLAGNYCLPNLHQVDKEGYIFRSMAPYKPKYISEINNLGVKQVLIFKDKVDHFMKTERAELDKLNISNELIKFPYQNIKSFTPVCQKTIKALKMLKKAVETKTKLLFHCTVGEDRTGYLSGLFNVLMYKADPEISFQEKMCKMGFANANPEKPFKKVVVPIRKALTPLYSKMSFLLAQSNYSLEEFNKQKHCTAYNFNNPKYKTYKEKHYPAFLCKKQKIQNWSCSSN